MSERGREIISHRGFRPGKPLLTWLLVAMLTITILGGCAGLGQSMGENPVQATLLCGAGGAAAGAAAGAALDEKNRLRGAIIGGLAGMLAGGATCFAVAKANSTPVKDYQQTRQAVGYRPTQGMLVRVERLQVDPASVSPGQKFTWRSEYVVMTPDPNADLPMVETRIVSSYDEKAKQWKEMGRHRTEVTVKPGTRLDEAEMTMPSTVMAQRYLVAFHVEHNQVSDHKSQEVLVAPRQASPAAGGNRPVVEMQGEDIRVAGL